LKNETLTIQTIPPHPPQVRAVGGRVSGMERRMSVMQCSRCEEMVDTDLDDFDFDLELCEECWYKVKEIELDLREEK